MLCGLAVLCLMSGLGAVPRAHAAPPDIAGAFTQLGTGHVETRTVALADLGVREPIVLHAPDTVQELYLPVPAGLPISGATLQLDGGYLRGDGGRTTLLVSLDGSPVLARNVTDAQGDGALSLGVDGAPRPSGFVRVGLHWSSVINDNVCADQTAIGNVWKIAPTSRLTWQFDTTAIHDVRTAMSAMPAEPMILVGSRTLSPSAYDTAWRIEALFMRNGATPIIEALPAVGDTIQIKGGLTVPLALQSLPAFSAMLAAGEHKISTPAELGALIALAQSGERAPDVIVSDEALHARIKQALDALRAQVVTAAPDAARAFDTWREQGAGLSANPLAPGEVRLVRIAGQPAVLVGDAQGVSALSRTWSPIDVSNRFVVHELAHSPNVSAGGDSDKLALTLLGGVPRTLDVLTSAAWETSFDLAAASGDGKIPRGVVFDLAAAPASTRNGQTASIFFNGVLIGSKLLNTDGHPQRIEADIPAYALGTTNQLRVLFQRQPEGGCQPRAQGYPVAVLPSSYLVVGRGALDDDFTGMVARFSSGANVLVPNHYLAEPLDSLPRVARLANAAGVSPTRASFAVLAEHQSATPAGPFLAIDVALDKPDTRVNLGDDRLTLKGRSGNVLADVSGLGNVGVIEVAHAGSTPGVLYRTVGTNAPALPATFQLLRGDVAVVDANGVVKQFDTLRPGAVPPADRQRAWFTEHWMAWGLPSLAILILVLLVFAAQRARRRARQAGPPPASADGGKPDGGPGPGPGPGKQG